MHDGVGKALRTANQGCVAANSHALSSLFDPGLRFKTNLRVEHSVGVCSSSTGFIQTIVRTSEIVEIHISISHADYKQQPS